MATTSGPPDSEDRIERSTQVTPPVAAAALQYRRYFRARRLDARGRWLQVDVTVAATREDFDACMRANPRPGAPG